MTFSLSCFPFWLVSAPLPVKTLAAQYSPEALVGHVLGRLSHMSC